MSCAPPTGSRAKSNSSYFFARNGGLKAGEDSDARNVARIPRPAFLDVFDGVTGRFAGILYGCPALDLPLLGVLRLRVKDKHASWLSGLAREVHGKHPDLADHIVRSAEVDLIAKRDASRTEWLNVIGQDSKFHDQSVTTLTSRRNYCDASERWKGRLSARRLTLARGGRRTLTDGPSGSGGDDALNETAIDGDYHVGIMVRIHRRGLTAFAPPWRSTFECLEPV